MQEDRFSKPTPGAGRRERLLDSGEEGAVSGGDV
jgi:hypothetical protein